MNKYWQKDFNSDEVEARVVERMARYRQECKDFWLKELPQLFVLCLVAAGIILPVLNFIGEKVDYLVFGCVMAALMILPARMIYPQRPSEEEVAYGMILNRLGNAVKNKNNDNRP